MLYTYFLFFLFFFINLFFYCKSKKTFIVILKDIRITRTIHFLMMIISGILIAGKTQVLTIDFDKFFEILFTLISVFYAVVYSTISNNFADVKIDSISNPGRPLPKQSVDAGEYSKAGKIIFVLSLLFGLTAGFKCLITSFLFMLFYHIYSKPPIRFKRFFIISKICISINSMILSFAGYLIFKNNLESYPAVFICFFLIVLTLVINFIDLKDFDGDKADNIKTIPVVFGLKKAKIICGIFYILTYIIAAFEFRPLIIAGFFQYYFINKKNYNEHYVFITYLISLVILFIYFLNQWNIKIIFTN